MNDTHKNVSLIDAAVLENRRWFILFGAMTMALGAGAIAFPLITTIATKIYVGWLFLIGGGIQVFHAFSESKWTGFLFELLVGVLYLVAGTWLAFFTLTGIVTLTLFLALTFAAQGILEAGLALRLRPHKGWIWMLIAGLVSIVVGILIIAKLPSSALWAIGLLVGIRMISSGWAFVSVAFYAPRGD